MSTSPINSPEQAWFDEHAPAYLDGRLGPQEATTMEELLNKHPQLKRDIEDIMQLDSTLRGQAAAIIPATGFEERIAKAVRQLRSPAIWQRPALRKAILALAAGVVIAGLGAGGRFLSGPDGLARFAPEYLRPRHGMNVSMARPGVTLYNGQAIAQRGRDGKWNEEQREKSRAGYVSDLEKTGNGKLGGSQAAEGDERRKENLDRVNGPRSVQEISRTSRESELITVDFPEDGTILMGGQRLVGSESELAKALSSSFANRSRVGHDTDVDGLQVTSGKTQNRGDGGWAGDKDARKEVNGLTFDIPSPTYHRLDLAEKGGALAAGDYTNMPTGQTGDWRVQEKIGIASGGKVDGRWSTGEGKSTGYGVGGGAGGGGGEGQAGTPTTPMAVNGTPAGITKPEGVTPAEQVYQRKLIRNGTMEFEVESFDGSFLTISKIVGEEGGFVASSASERLSNGKVRGTITVRVAPDRLDMLVMKLRALGELKNQQISVQDITKQYNDLEGELRAARTMEARMLKIIESGKGEVKDLVEAEKQLGVYRAKIEKFEGEIRYYASMVSLSTLNLTLAEKEIKSPLAAYETETRSVGLEAEDVEKTYTQALEALTAAGGRIIQSNLRKLDAGQFQGTIVAEVKPDKAGEITDRFRQLGKLARLEVDRNLNTEGGEGKPGNIKVERRDTRFSLNIYNLANIQPRQQMQMTLVSEDVEAACKQIQAQAIKSGGRVVTSTVQRPRPDQPVGTLNVEVPEAEAETLLAGIRGGSRVVRQNVTENADSSSVTSAKRGFQLQVISQGAMSPRVTTSLALVVSDTADAQKAILAAATEAGATIVDSSMTQRPGQSSGARITLETTTAKGAAIVEAAIARHGETATRSESRSSDTGNTLEDKTRWTLGIEPIENIAPKRTVSVEVEAADVRDTFSRLTQLAKNSSAKVSKSNLQQSPDGDAEGVLNFIVPASQADRIESSLSGIASVGRRSVSENSGVTLSERSARTEFAITVKAEGRVVPANAGVWSSVKLGLGTSAMGLLWSLQLVVVGLLFALPWALIGWGVVRIVKRRRTAAAGGQ